MTKTIQTSKGEAVDVGQLNWLGFKRLKSLIAKTVSGTVLRETVDIVTGPIGSVVGDLLQSIAAAIQPGEGAAASQAELAAKLSEKWGEAQTVSLVIGGLEHLKGSIAAVLNDLLQTSDEFTELLIVGSCSKPVKLESLSIDDVVALRDAALDANDLGKLFDLEKNWWGRVITSGRACLGTQTSKSLGTSTTSTD